MRGRPVSTPHHLPANIFSYPTVQRYPKCPNMNLQTLTGTSFSTTSVWWTTHPSRHHLKVNSPVKYSLVSLDKINLLSCVSCPLDHKLLEGNWSHKLTYFLCLAHYKPSVKCTSKEQTQGFTATTTPLFPHHKPSQLLTLQPVTRDPGKVLR